MERTFGAGVLTAALCLGVALAPLPLGSNRNWAWSPLAVTAGLLLLIQAVTAIAGRSPAFAHFRRLLVPAILAALVVLWIAVQLTGWTPQEWRSPPVEATAVELGGTRTTVALDVGRGWDALTRLLTYFAFFLLAADLAGRARAGRTILLTIVLSAVVYTAVALAAEALKRNGLVGDVGQRPPFIGLAGPFVNRNNYATYIGFAALLALARVLESQPALRARDESARLRWRRRLEFASTTGGLHLVAFVMLTVAMIMSWSRGALFGYVLAICVLISLLSSGWLRWAGYAVVAIGLVFMALYLPSAEMLMNRFFVLSSEAAGSRVELAAITLKGIALRPLLGWGMGSFEDLYLLFQTPHLPQVFDKAHNTYLEMAFELGVPAAAILTLAVAVVGGRCLLGVRERSKDRDLPAAGIACLVLAAVHSAFDFSLQIPAVSVTLAVVLGVAWAQSWSSRRSPDVNPERREDRVAE